MSKSTKTTPLPKYIYKILPPTHQPPTPLPANLPLSALDRRDAFLHFSTSSQILSTLQNFFEKDPYVWILRVPYEKVEKYVKWEDALGKGPDEKGGCWDIEGTKGLFPHVYGNGEMGVDECGLRLGREEVDGVGKWVKGGEEWGVERWPFEEDGPRG